jgi:putative transposase
VTRRQWARSSRSMKPGSVIISGRWFAGTVEEALNVLLDTEADRLCGAGRYERSFSHVPATKLRDVSHMLKAIHAQESREAADGKARAIVDDLRAAKKGTAADLVERSVSETPTYYAFPDIQSHKIRTNNPLERIT